MSLLGVDIGTSSVKVAAFPDDVGVALATASASYPATFPAPGRMELEPELVWQAFLRSVRSVAAEPAVRHDPVTAIAFSVSCDEVIPVAADGSPVAACILAPDTRGGDVVETLRGRFDEAATYRRTGLPLAAIHPLARILWYRRHEPEVANAAGRWLGWGEFILDRLGLPAATDETTAARWLAFDVAERGWWADAVRLAGLDESALPTVVAPATPIDRLGVDAAHILGLGPDVLVVAGAHDQICAAIGAGLNDPGDAVVGTGTWENTTIVLARPLEIGALERGITWGPYVGGRYAALLMNPGGLSIVRWFVDEFTPGDADAAHRAGQDPYARAVSRASRATTDVLVLPHFQGSLAPWRDLESKGAVIGLTLATTREELLRAVLEGITFELRLNLESIPGGPVIRSPLRNTGGGARTREWTQLKADILGRPVATMANDEPGCLGAAILAGVGSSVYATVHEAQERLCRIEHTVDPDPLVRDRYDARFALYRALYPTIRPLTVQA